jgi:hypothetical protein
LSINGGENRDGRSGVGSKKWFNCNISGLSGFIIEGMIRKECRKLDRTRRKKGRAAFKRKKGGGIECCSLGGARD